MASVMMKASAGFVPFRASKRYVAVRATGGDSNAAAQAPKQGLVFRAIPTLTFSPDNETIRDVFAFAGSAPGRIPHASTGSWIWCMVGTSPKLHQAWRAHSAPLGDTVDTPMGVVHGPWRVH